MSKIKHITVFMDVGFHNYYEDEAEIRKGILAIRELKGIRKIIIIEEMTQAEFIALHNKRM